MRWLVPLLPLALLACSDDATRRRGPADGEGQADPVGISQGGDGKGGSGQAGRGGSTSSPGGAAGTWGGVGSTCAPATTSGQGGACAADSFEAAPSPLSLYLMIDRSGSMLNLTGAGPSKWDALRDAFGDVLAAPPVDNLSVAAQFFPSFTGDICNAAAYAEPVVGLKSAGSARALLLSAMSEKPDGTTPTGPALEGALSQARLWARQRPDEATAVVLATDGQPTECSPIAAGDLASLAAAALVDSPQQPGVPTFVVGILGVNDLGSGARQDLDAIARSGGTGAATLVDPSRDVTAQFADALRSVATRGVSCALALPAAVDDIGKLSLVNVALTSDACGRRVLSYVDEAADCGSGDGWTYDVDPASGQLPKKAVLCPLSCERYRAGAQASIEVGCLTQGWTK